MMIGWTQSSIIWRSPTITGGLACVENMNVSSAYCKKLNGNLSWKEVVSQISSGVECVYQGIDDSIEDDNRERITLVDPQLDRDERSGPCGRTDLGN